MRQPPEAAARDTAEVAELTRHELRKVVELTDALLDVTGPAQLRPVLLAGLAGVVGADAALWHEVDVRPPVREVAVSWPADRLSMDAARRAAPVLGTHPLFAVFRPQLARGVAPPRIGRLSDYASRRQWHATPLYREALTDVDDQLLLVTRARGPLVEFVSVERQGRSFRDRERDVLQAAARHVVAGLRRARSGPHPGIATAPRPRRMLLNPQRPPDAGGAAPLTSRQHEVLALAAEGRTDDQIARELGTSGRTVSKHLQRIYANLQVSGRVQAVDAVFGINRPPPG